MKQIIYTSAATQPFPPDALRELLARARKRNTVYGVSGMLLFHTGSFLQVLEGEDSYVDMILASIQRDRRHTNTKVLLDQRVAAREFEAWSMGFVDTSRSNAQPTGLVDYFNPQPLVALKSGSARKYLDFFRQGLCRQTVPAAALL